MLKRFAFSKRHLTDKRAWVLGIAVVLALAQTVGASQYFDTDEVDYFGDGDSYDSDEEDYDYYNYDSDSYSDESDTYYNGDEDGFTSEEQPVGELNFEEYAGNSTSDTYSYYYDTMGGSAGYVQGQDMPGVTTDLIPGWPEGPEISASSALVMEDSSNMVLYAKNADLLVDPGSAVKIMTALLALENSELTDQVIMSEESLSGVTEGGLTISAQVGEEFTMEQCLYAVLLASANDCALQIAVQVGGSIPHFVQMMNERAQALGCSNTTFTNPTGLEDPNQLSTAHDMALIMQAAIAQYDFVKIATAKSFRIPATNLSGGERVLTNTFGLLDNVNVINNRNPNGVEILGGKQGYTETSGSILIWAAKKGTRTLICALFRGYGDVLRYDAEELMDYGFNEFSLLQLGNEDYDILSGGDVIVPSGTHMNTLKTRDTLVGEDLVRTYFYGEVVVGKAIIDPMEDNSAALISAGDANLQIARQFSEEKAVFPYFLIVGMGIALIILVGVRLNHYLNSDEEEEEESE